MLYMNHLLLPVALLTSRAPIKSIKLLHCRILCITLIEMPDKWRQTWESLLRIHHISGLISAVCHPVALKQRALCVEMAWWLSLHWSVHAALSPVLRRKFTWLEVFFQFSGHFSFESHLKLLSPALCRHWALRFRSCDFGQIPYFAIGIWNET